MLAPVERDASQHPLIPSGCLCFSGALLQGKVPKRAASAVCPNLSFFWQRRRVSINTHLLLTRSKAILPGQFWRPYKVERITKSSNEMQKSLMNVYRRK